MDIFFYDLSVILESWAPFLENIQAGIGHDWHIKTGPNFSLTFLPGINNVEFFRG